MFQDNNKRFLTRQVNEKAPRNVQVILGRMIAKAVEEGANLDYL